MYFFQRAGSRGRISSRRGDFLNKRNNIKVDASSHSPGISSPVDGGVIGGPVRFCVATGCPIGGWIVWPKGGVLIDVCAFFSFPGAVFRTVSLTCAWLPSFVVVCVVRCVAFVLFSFCMGVDSSWGSLMLGFVFCTAVFGVGGFSSMWSAGLALVFFFLAFADDWYCFEVVWIDLSNMYLLIGNVICGILFMLLFSSCKRCRAYGR